MESNCYGGELPSTLKFCHVIAHVGKQGFENLWLLILLHCLKNPCLQLLPSLRLTCAGSRLGVRRASTTAYTVLFLQLVLHPHVISRSSGLLALEDVDNHPKRLFALRIA